MICRARVSLLPTGLSQGKSQKYLFADAYTGLSQGKSQGVLFINTAVPISPERSLGYCVKGAEDREHYCM